MPVDLNSPLRWRSANTSEKRSWPILQGNPALLGEHAGFVKPGTGNRSRHWTSGPVCKHAAELANCWGQPEKKDFDFHGFVTMKGGEYFFAPCIRFLKRPIVVNRPGGMLKPAKALAKYRQLLHERHQQHTRKAKSALTFLEAFQEIARPEGGSYQCSIHQPERNGNSISSRDRWSSGGAAEEGPDVATPADGAPTKSRHITKTPADKKCQGGQGSSASKSNRPPA